jgi:hypothetical protein
MTAALLAGIAFSYFSLYSLFSINPRDDETD